jgi:hypothetical protein
MNQFFDGVGVGDGSEFITEAVFSVAGVSIFGASAGVVLCARAILRSVFFIDTVFVFGVGAEVGRVEVRAGKSCFA